MNEEQQATTQNRNEQQPTSQKPPGDFPKQSTLLGVFVEFTKVI